MPDFLGPYGGALALAFAAGAGSGYGFFAVQVFNQFKRLWEQRAEALISDRIKAEQRAEAAEEHFKECDNELIQLKVRVARLEERYTEK